MLLDDETQTAILDTWGAALAANGFYEPAVAAADAALRTARRDPGLAEQIRARRDAYVHKRPYLEERPAPPVPPAASAGQREQRAALR